MVCSRFSLRRAALAGLLAMAAMSSPLAAQTVPDAAPDPAPNPGQGRDGPFVMTDKILGDLLKDGYEIRANLGNFLILQKKSSVFSCGLSPDPARLSYKPYFQCAELREERPLPGARTQP